MAIQYFEDLDCWKLGRELSRGIYTITKSSGFSKDYGLKDQIRRAAVSVMTNVAEGYERGTNKDFAKFLYIARGSASGWKTGMKILLMGWLIQIFGTQFLLNHQ